MQNMKNNEFVFEYSPVATAHIEELESEAMLILGKMNKCCPCLNNLRSNIISEAMKFEDNFLGISFPKIVDHPVTQLLTYINSTHNVVWQVLYSVERLAVLSDWMSLSSGTSSLMDHFISYYFSGFVAKVKATTDILGLMINHLFELGIDRKKCGLERGVIANKLLDKVSAVSPNRHIGQLSLDLEYARTQWIKDFYDLRNVVAHRDEMWPNTLGIRFLDESDPASIVTAHPFIIRPTPHNSQLLDYAKRISPSSVVSYESMDAFIDPQKFCVNIWEKVSSLLDCVGKGCQPQIQTFVKNNCRV